MPQLSEANVRLIGIGLEELGVEEFIEGKFFEGELYIDVDKKSFKDLEFKRMGVLNLIPALFSKISRAVIKKGKEWGIASNMHGDGFQNGGLIVVEAKGEKLLYEFKQDNPADHAPNSAILQALGIEEETAGATAEESNEPLNVTDLECEEVCAMPAKE